MGTALKVLHVEDDFADAMLLQHSLFDAGVDDLELEVVRTLHDARWKLERNPYDLVILDLRLPDSVNPQDTIRTAEQHAGATPLLVLTGSAIIDGDVIGPHINLLDKNVFFHGKDPLHTQRLAGYVRAAVGGALLV